MTRHRTGPVPPRVSVVTPVHDAQAFLEDAVESVLAQTFRSWELHLVDDGSTDGSRSLAERYAREYPGRIRVLHHPHHERRGASAARNLGIRHARGEYVALLDADDVWVPEKLEKQIAFLDSRPTVAAVGSWYRQMDREGKPKSAVELPCSNHDIAWALVCYCPLLHSSVVVRRAPVDERVGWYDESMPTGEDYDLWGRIAEHFEVANLPEYLVYYRVHEASLSATEGRRGAHAQRLREERMSRMLGWETDPPDVRRARSRAAAALALGWADSPDPVALLGGVEDLHRLHDVFAREIGLPARACRHQRRGLDQQIAASLLAYSSQFRADRPGVARSLFFRAIRVYWPVVLRIRTWTRAVRLLVRSAVESGSVRSVGRRSG